jgi:hypothetical protein
MTDTYNIILDKGTVDRIDAWRRQSLFEPSRRAATRALVRMALKVLQQKKDRAKAAAPATAAPSRFPEVSRDTGGQLYVYDGEKDVPVGGPAGEH